MSKVERESEGGEGESGCECERERGIGGKRWVFNLSQDDRSNSASQSKVRSHAQRTHSAGAQQRTDRSFPAPVQSRRSSPTATPICAERACFYFESTKKVQSTGLQTTVSSVLCVLCTLLLITILYLNTTE